MGMLQRAAISVVRPVYKAFLERPLWWFLAKVKAFFFAETSERLAAIENRLTALERAPRIEDLLRHAEAGNAAQWDALEQLLLAVFRQPEARSFDTEKAAYKTSAAVAGTSGGTESIRVNGPNTLR